MSEQPASAGFLLTIFLKHDQSKPLAEINLELEANDYFKKFPPPGIEIVSWYVMMGIGQVVTLRVPPERLREVNRAIEESAIMTRSEEHTSELQSLTNLVCRLLLEKKK